MPLFFFVFQFLQSKTANNFCQEGNAKLISLGLLQCAKVSCDLQQIIFYNSHFFNKILVNLNFFGDYFVLLWKDKKQRNFKCKNKAEFGPFYIKNDCW